MSTNRRNTIRKAPLLNFTHNVEYRNIIIESSNFSTLSTSIGYILNDTNKTIQELSLCIHNRQIPFIIAITTTHSNIQKPSDTRIVLWGHDYSLVSNLYQSTDRNTISHLIEFQLSASYNQITFSNSIFDAKLVIDEKYLKIAATDLFLDLAMFNSYSFLRNMSIDEKRLFSKQKFEYFKNNNLDCYYTYDEDDILLYYSLAFSARTDQHNIDLEKYIKLWDDFIKTYYSHEQHYEDSLEQQLKKHMDFGQLPTKKILDETTLLSPGAYLFIRVNRQPKNHKTTAQMLSIFGKDHLNIGDWKIIPTHNYSLIKELTQTLHVSAFKLIKVQE